MPLEFVSVFWNFIKIAGPKRVLVHISSLSKDQIFVFGHYSNYYLLLQVSGSATINFRYQFTIMWS